MLNARCIILRVKQAIFHQLFVILKFSEIFVFLFIDVLLNFRKYLRSVLFPSIVISAFMGFVL